MIKLTSLDLYKLAPDKKLHKSIINDIRKII